MNRYDWLDAYLLSKSGCTKDYKAEWGWLRYQVGGRMFAATCRPDLKHEGYDGRELLTLKCEPLLSELLRSQYKDVVPGFYMDKRCWISVFLDGEVPDGDLRDMCDRSYALVLNGLTKKAQRQLGGEKDRD